MFKKKVVRCDDTGVDAGIPGQSAPNGESAPSVPLQYETYAKEWQQISQQDNFDGFRVEGSKTISPLLQASHSLFLGTTLRECGYMYNFGPIFQSKDQRTLLIGKVGLDGCVNGRIQRKFFDDAGEFKLNGNSSLKDPQRNVYEAALDYAGKDWCSSMKVCWQMAWVVNGSFSQMITPKLHVGGELIRIGIQGGASIGTVGFRYSNGDDTCTGTFSRSPDFKNPARTSQIHQAKLQYVRRVNERLSLGTEFEYSVPDQESALKVGYEYNFRQARVQGHIDTSGKIGCMVSDFQGFGFSGTIDYLKNDYKFGFMMHIQT